MNGDKERSITATSRQNTGKAVYIPTNIRVGNDIINSLCNSICKSLCESH